MLDPDLTGVIIVKATETLPTRSKRLVFTREKIHTIEKMRTPMESISCSSSNNSQKTNISPMKLKNSMLEEEVSGKSRTWLDN